MNFKFVFSLNLFALSLLFGLQLPISSQAKVFRNAYLSIEVPDSWSCGLEQTEWVCRAGDLSSAKEAIIIITAKEVGATDTFSAYEEYLNRPIHTQNRAGIVLVSKIIYMAKKSLINDQNWLDGLHFGSEVANYYTRYLISQKDKISILVTMSAHKQFYSKYSHDFFEAIKSLRIIAAKNLLSNPSLGPISPSGKSILGSKSSYDSILVEGLPSETRVNSRTGIKLKALMPILGAFFIVVYILLRRGKKK